MLIVFIGLLGLLVILAGRLTHKRLLLAIQNEKTTGRALQLDRDREQMKEINIYDNHSIIEHSVRVHLMTILWFFMHTATYMTHLASISPTLHLNKYYVHSKN